MPRTGRRFKERRRRPSGMAFLDSTEEHRTNRWVGLVAASMGMFLGSLDITVNVALPDITSSFGADVQTIQWIIIFYVGGTTGLQLSLGSAVDVYGLKRFYIIGLGVYTLAVLLIGLAPFLSLVFGLRVLQAVGNGLIMASAPALVTSIFPSEERGRGLGLMAGIAALGTVAGALGGGALVDSFGWRAIFIGRVPLGILAVILAVISLRERPRIGTQAFDFRGSVALFVGLATFILFLTLGSRSGWTAPHVLLLVLISAISLIGFGFMQRTASRPVLDLHLLKHRVLSPVMIASFLMSLAIFVNLFVLPFYVSETLKVGARSLGFLLMLTPVATGAAAPIGGWMSDRMPPAYLTTLALIIITSAMYWFSRLGADSTVAQVAIRMGVLGFGMGLFQAANATLIMGTVPGDRLGTGGAILSISRSMGTVCSVAIMGAVFASRLDAHTVSLAQQGITAETGSAIAFVMAFKDTYLVSALLAGLALLVSLSYWPQLIRR